MPPLRLKLENIPIPEPYIIGIILSLLLKLFFPARIFSLKWIGHLSGWSLVVIGVIISVWAALEAGEVSTAEPEKLITSGPYTYSRNPMYVSWTLIFLGIIFVLNSIWSLGLLVIVLIYIHFFEIRSEEAYLQKKFGRQYKEYQAKVRRYL